MSHGERAGFLTSMAFHTQAKAAYNTSTRISLTVNSLLIQRRFFTQEDGDYLHTHTHTHTHTVRDDLSVAGESHGSAADLPGARSSDLSEEKDGADDAPRVPARPSEEELRNTITHHLSVNPTDTDQNQGAGSSDLSEEKDGADDAPRIPARPSEEELRNTITHHLSVNPTDTDQNQDDSDWEFVSEAAGAVDKEKILPKKNKVKKKKNPFLPHVTAKSKMIQKRSGEDGAEGLEKKSLMEQLNEFRLEGVDDEDEEDLDSLMVWWSTVKQWEPMSKDEEMTEKEEAKAFALTAEKVQRGIRVFNQLFSERAEALWQHIIDLHLIADGLDRFNKRAKLAQITGGSTSAVGGVATITGLALAPVTMGTSLIVTAVGLGVAAAGGLTSASAGISNSVHGSMDRKKVERILKDFQSKMGDIDKCTRFIKRGIENLREFN
ncbi:uncharacterized protein DAT39_020001, partial [Clarias magur]